MIKTTYKYRVRSEFSQWYKCGITIGTVGCQWYQRTVLAYQWHGSTFLLISDPHRPHTSQSL